MMCMEKQVDYSSKTIKNTFVSLQRGSIFLIKNEMKQSFCLDKNSVLFILLLNVR